MEGALDAGQPARTPPVGVLLAAGQGRRMGRPKALVRDPDGNLVNFFTPVTPEAVRKFAR